MLVHVSLPVLTAGSIVNSWLICTSDWRRPWTSSSSGSQPSSTRSGSILATAGFAGMNPAHDWNRPESASSATQSSEGVLSEWSEIVGPDQSAKSRHFSKPVQSGIRCHSHRSTPSGHSDQLIFFVERPKDHNMRSRIGETVYLD